MWANFSPKLALRNPYSLTPSLENQGKQKAYNHLFPRQYNVLIEHNLVQMLNLPPTRVVFAKLFWASFLKKISEASNPH